MLKLKFASDSIKYALRVLTNKFHSKTRANKICLGLGSNVVDYLFQLESLPKEGLKGYFTRNRTIPSARKPGGVTLNHLAWASKFGVKTGLLALQGSDSEGFFLRKCMAALNVRTNLIEVSRDYQTGFSYILVEPKGKDTMAITKEMIKANCNNILIDGNFCIIGERTIIMCRGSTVDITDSLVSKFFPMLETTNNNTVIFSTEISQVPLSGVVAALTHAKSNGCITLLDVDVSPLVAINEAKLGTLDQLIEAIKLSDVVKTAGHVVRELHKIFTNDQQEINFSKELELANSTSLSEVAKDLQQLTNSKLLAVTNGSRPCVLSSQYCTVSVPPAAISSNTIQDTTGAGDAFLGGILKWIYENGLPESEDELKSVGTLANQIAGECCQTVGGCPELGENWDNLNNIPNSFAQSLKADASSAEKLYSILSTEEIHSFMNTLNKCKGRILVSGIGRSSIIGQRMVGSFISLGLVSLFVHAAEWGHGDLGVVRPGEDIVIFLSHSGYTIESINAVNILKDKGVHCLCITSNRDSILAARCDQGLVYDFGNPIDSQLVGGAPTTSIIVMEMIINAIMCEIAQHLSLSAEDIASYHPWSKSTHY